MPQGKIVLPRGVPETEAALRIIVDPIDGTAVRRSDLPLEEFNQQIFSYTIDGVDHVAFLFTSYGRKSFGRRTFAGIDHAIANYFMQLLE